MLVRTEVSSSPELRAGELVEVRSKEEILATLDERGQLNSLPFMPEMLKFCGKRFRVSKSAHKTCDTIEKTGARRMHKAVHLEDLRCDGAAHGGCQAGCLIYWKESWLKRVDQDTVSRLPLTTFKQNSYRCSEQGLFDSACRTGTSAAGSGEEINDTVYTCQTTQLLKATQPLKWWDVRQYVKDVTSGNITVSQLLQALAFSIFAKLTRIGAYHLLVSAYDRVQSARGGTPFPFRAGNLKSATPAETLSLQEGEQVQVKTQAEILETVNAKNKNRGLSFDPEMVKYCGGTFRVLSRVERIINENTGKMMQLPNDCIMLDRVTCTATISQGRLFCPRGSYHYWREIWLKRAK